MRSPPREPYPRAVVRGGACRGRRVAAVLARRGDGGARGGGFLRASSSCLRDVSPPGTARDQNDRSRDLDLVRRRGRGRDARDGDRIFASSLTRRASCVAPASAPRVARRARASRRWTTPSWKRATRCSVVGSSRVYSSSPWRERRWRLALAAARGNARVVAFEPRLELARAAERSRARRRATSARSRVLPFPSFARQLCGIAPRKNTAVSGRRRVGVFRGKPGAAFVSASSRPRRARTSSTFPRRGRPAPRRRRVRGPARLDSRDAARRAAPATPSRAVRSRRPRGGGGAALVGRAFPATRDKIRRRSSARAARAFRARARSSNRRRRRAHGPVRRAGRRRDVRGGATKRQTTDAVDRGPRGDLERIDAVTRDGARVERRTRW